MRKNSVIGLAVVLLLAGASLAQVLSPAEIKDADLRALQQQYMDDLRQVGQDILANQFEYPFYLSRKLDLDQAQQAKADQRSIRFDRFNSQIVLAVTGNYYAAYSSDKLTKDQRARETFSNVVIPILKAAVPRLQSNQQIKGYAVEISHHITGKVMGVAMERPENLMVYLPQAAAIRLVAAKENDTQQAALLQGQVFLNAQPITIWLGGEGPQLANSSASEASPNNQTPSHTADIEIVHASDRAEQVSGPAPVPGFPKAQPPSAAARDTSPSALSVLQAANRELIGRFVKELDSQAHFVSYVEPSFVAFRQGIYLEFSINTSLPESAGGSRYKLAAMAFDDHVAHLVRPTLAYFKDDTSFDGIGFSTTVHVAAKSAAASTSQAVEFFFPFSALHCYERYDCTGQQLIDAGTVLVNGERVGLDLQVAEASAR